MRYLWIGAFLLAPLRPAFSAAGQELIPILRQTDGASGSATSEWKTYFRVAEMDGVTYLSLVQIAEVLNGTLNWRTVSKSVELSVYGHTIRFPYSAASASIDGRRVKLERSTVKDDRGFWVPATFFASDRFFKVARAKLAWPPPEESKSLSDGERDRKQKEPEALARPASSPPKPSEAPHAVKRIVIDPGHGGKDPGAVGPHGAQEKTLNLRMAQELADTLRETYGYEVLLTRMDDTFIPLEERAKLANKQNADLFISVHCNASTSPKLHGFEVYFLSEDASDPHADSVARLENAALALEGREVPSPSRVKEVLRSLVKTANINEASTLGALLDRHLAERLSEPSLGVKQAGFYVLRGAEMPAVLVETAFVSNPHDEQMLQDPEFRRKLVEGIAAGVVAYDSRKAKEHR